ncbi:MAG: YceI family protein [Bacteroidia bacterium]|nr:YceI family protein [Bacteroidia bacterium]
MKNLFLSVILITLTVSFALGQTQRYFTKTGNISFFSKMPVENIEAHNRSATCVLDASTGKIEFAVLMKGFEFEKALMQEHFNENYVESSKYPKATFKGTIANPAAVNWKKDGTYSVTVSGDMTIKDRTNKVSAPGTITVKAGKVTAVSTFKLLLADYDIKIPGAVKDKISETIDIKVNVELAPMN